MAGLPQLVLLVHHGMARTSAVTSFTKHVAQFFELLRGCGRTTLVMDRVNDVDCLCDNLF